MAEATIDDILDETPPDTPQRRSALRRSGESLGRRLLWALPWLAMLVVGAAIAPFRDRWFVQVALLGWLVFAPGRLLLTALRLRPIQVRRFPVYTVATSLLLIMVEGLAVDGIGIALGDEHPLRTGPLWAGTVVGYVLLVVAAAAAPDRCRPQLSRPPSPWAYWVLALPLLAAAGAYRLNSGQGSTVALIAMIALVAVWLVRPFLPGFTWRTASITVYAVSLAGCWSFSLRGDSVYGYDIISEYFIGHATASASVWHLNHAGDAYGGLLSVTILPASLHSVAGVAILAVFKTLFPVIFAFVPVGVLHLARNFVAVRWAYVAVGLVVGQAFFFSSLTSVTRQEIAFVMFIAMLGAMVDAIDHRLDVLVGLFAVGSVVSHYSSTYMAAALTGAATALALLARVVHRKPPVLRSAIGFVVLAGGALLWYRGLTNSASNVSNVADTFRANGLDLLPNRSGNLFSTLVEGNVAAPMNAHQYAADIAQRYRVQDPFVSPLSLASRFPIADAKQVPDGGVIATVGGIVISLISQIVNLLAFFGSLLLVFGRRRSTPGRLAGLLALGVLGFLIVVRVSGSIAVSYNQERAQIQAFMLLAPVAVVAVNWLLNGMRTRSARRRRASRRAQGCLVRTGAPVAVALIASTVLVLNAAGLLSGHPEQYGAANVSKSGEEVSRFLLDEQDLRAARWLSSTVPADEVIYADAYGRLRLLSFFGSLEHILPDLTPETLSSRAWVYAYSANVEQGEARATFDGRPVRYRFPRTYITTFYDRVYENGTAEVFHR